MELARSALDQYHNQDLSETQKAAADLVLDFTAEETTCPACLSSFATKDAGEEGAERCPSCGLFLGT